MQWKNDAIIIKPRRIRMKCIKLNSYETKISQQKRFIKKTTETSFNQERTTLKIYTKAISVSTSLMSRRSLGSLGSQCSLGSLNSLGLDSLGSLNLRSDRDSLGSRMFVTSWNGGERPCRTRRQHKHFCKFFNNSQVSPTF